MERTREQILDLVRRMREHTVESGCTPGEAAKFAAKAAEWAEEYQIAEAELRRAEGGRAEDIEVCQNTLRTGKRVFNPGMTQVVNGLALGMCCKCILLHQDGEAVYGIIGEQADADLVCQIATTVVPALQIMARLEGAEHGHEKAGLVRWSNQYLTGAGQEIRRRLEDERKERSEAKEAPLRIEAERSSAASGTECRAIVVTGETLAVAKRAAVAEAFATAYPRTRTTRSRSEYNHTAHERGREAGRRVGLHLEIE